MRSKPHNVGHTKMRYDRNGRAFRGGPRAAAADGEGFVCVHCGVAVPGGAPGTHHRNHCPLCLWSSHVDIKPGDRLSGCRGEMEPIAVSVKRNGEWTLIHRCTRCGTLRSNRIAGDDNEYALLSLAAKPMAGPPFPLDHLAQGDRGTRGGRGHGSR
jgi:hypothetical protein